MHRGIANRPFRRTFRLAEYVEVTGAGMQNIVKALPILECSSRCFLNSIHPLMSLFFNCILEPVLLIMLAVFFEPFFNVGK